VRQRIDSIDSLERFREGIVLMARTLQALRRDAEPGGLRVAAPPEVSATLVPGEEEIPFIEVGGKDTPMEASPSVLACAPGPGAKLQVHRPASVEPAAAEEPTPPSTSEQAPAIVAFRPLMGEAQPLAPPLKRVAPELLTFHQPDHAVSRQYDEVAKSIEQQLPASRSRVLLFSAVAGADASEVVLNLAIVQARRRSSRLIVVDANFGNARTTARLGLAGRAGLRDVLAGFCSLDRAFIDTGIESLTALTAGRENPLPCLVAGDAMLSVLRHLRARFDCVMIDAPAWDGRPDVTALGAACDAIYLVVRKGDANSEATRNLLQLIPLQGGSLKGCVLT
jgi:Mrp family chromosome partitioning ATPase